MRDRRRPLGDRLHQINLAEAALQRELLVVDKRTAAADDQHGHAVEVGVRYRGDDVGDSRARRDHGHADAARRARPAVGGVPGGLFVPRVHQPEFVADGSLEDRVQVSAMEGEDAVDPLGNKHAYQDLAAVYFSHASASCRHQQPHVHANCRPCRVACSGVDRPESWGHMALRIRWRQPR